MKSLRFAEDQKVYPILSPADITTSVTNTSYVDLKYIHRGTIALHFGSMTSDSTDTATVTLQCSTASTSNATEVPIAFQYRLTAAVGTDSMGAITAATTDGVAVTATDDGKVLLVDVDPAAVANLGADYRYVRAVITPSAQVAACVVGAIFYGDMRYSQNVPPSSSS